MIWFFTLLIAGCGITVAVALVRGLGAFYKDAERIRAGDPDAVLKFGVQQNRMMTQRVLFQGIAVLLVALLGMLASR